MHSLCLPPIIHDLGCVVYACLSDHKSIEEYFCTEIHILHDKDTKSIGHNNLFWTCTILNLHVIFNDFGYMIRNLRGKKRWGPGKKLGSGGA